MLFDQLYEFYQRVSSEEWRESEAEQNFYFLFKGNITQEIIVSFTEKAQKKLALSDEMYNKLIFSVMIEMFQNVQKHSIERCENNSLMQSHGKGILLFEKLKEKILIATGNIVRNESVKLLEDRCKFINKLNRDQLREYYNMERRNSATAKRKGGNVGLIDMAKKSGNALDIRTIRINEKQSFYSLAVSINKNSDFE